MDSYLLSIVVPVFKVEKFLHRCVDSIVSQINESVEVVLVDDGSPDQCPKICDEYSRKYSNIHVVHQKNQGLSSARNKGLQFAKGEYVWCVDSDDWLEKGAICSVLSVLSQSYDVYACNLMYSYDDVRLNHMERPVSGNREVSVSNYILNYSVGASQRYIIRNSFLKKNSLFFYPGIYHEDAEFGPRMLSCTKSIFFLDGVLYHYYQRTSGSIMSSWKLKNSQDALFATRKCIDLLKLDLGLDVKSSIAVLVLRMYYFAFPLEKNIQEVYSLFLSTKREIRLFALKGVFMYRMDFHRLLMFLVSVVSPTLYIKIKR